MYPILLQFGSFKLYSWGFLLAVAVIIGTYLVMRRSDKYGYTADNVLDLAIYLVLGGLIGARLFFVFVYEPAYYLQNPWKIIALWEGGMVFYGGFIGGFLAGLWYIKRKNWDFWPLADLFAPSLALGYGIVRIGCFLNGCCYGKPTSSKWGVIFPELDHLYRYPTQIYSSLLGFALFAFLVWLQKRKQFSGQVFLAFVLLYGIGRTVIESFRENLLVLGPITVAQLVSFFVFVLAFVFYVIKKHQNKL